MSTDWREGIRSALMDFAAASELAGDRVDLGAMEVELLHAPHKPGSLPKGRMAVYGFWYDDGWLKIGRVGPNSNARYRSQHYTGSAMSTLAGSIRSDSLMPGDVRGLGREDLARWIEKNTCRVNILLPSTRNRSLLLLLEAFLHVRLHPRYEG